MVRFNRQETCASVVMAFPVGLGSRMVADYRAANAKVELMPSPTQGLELMSVGDVAAHKYRIIAQGRKGSGVTRCILEKV